MLVVVGDSIAEGHCAHGPGEQGWVGLIEQKLMQRGDADWRRICSVAKVAISGTTLAEVLPMVEGTLRGRRKVHDGVINMLAMVGGREAIALAKEEDDHVRHELPVTLDEFEASVRALVRLCEKPQPGEADKFRVNLGFVGSYPVAPALPYARGPWNFYLADETYQAYQEPVRRVAAEYGVPYIDIHATFSEQAQREPVLAADQVHPNSLGHQLIAEAVAPYLGLDETIRDRKLVVPKPHLAAE